MTSHQQLQIPCLGRPFNLGMLYNRHTDKIVPGMSIWSAKKVESTKFSNEQQQHSSYEVLSEDSIQTKFSSLGIDPHLKLSYLSHLVEVEGAAKFLCDQRSSEEQSRVTLHYRSTTHFEQLAKDQLGEAESLVDEQVATHVVTGIQYGSDAFFVFDRDVKKTEVANLVNKNMVLAVQEIPKVNQRLSDSLLIYLKAGTNLFQCKFYGDLDLVPSPTTFDEAVKQFRKLLKTQANSVPRRAFLCPLSEVVKGFELVLNPVPSSLISQVGDIKENFASITMQVNNLMMTTTCHKFSEVKCQLSSFKKSLACFTVDFEDKLSHLVPKVRRGAEDVKKLSELMSRIYESPFYYKDTKAYLKCKDKELKQLHLLLESIEMNPVVFSSFPGTAFDLMSLVHDSRYEHVVCFAFNVTTETSPYVRNLELYNQTGEAKPLSDTDKEWFDKPFIVEQLKSEIAKFLAFAESQPPSKNMAFVVTSSTKVVDEAGPCTVVYSGGIPMLFDVPGTPQSTDATMNTITLHWSAPKRTEVCSYRIIFRSEGDSDFKSTDSLGLVTTHRVENLCSGTEYQFKVQALTTSNFPLESALANFKTTEYYDIVLVGKTGQGKSTLGNKLLNVENTDESKLLVFQPTNPLSPSDDASASSATVASVPVENALSPISSDSATAASPTSTKEPASAQACPQSSTVAPAANATIKKRFLQADDPEAGQTELSITDECKLMSNEVTKIRVLDVPGFSDSGTLKRKIGKEVSVFDGNLQIVRWIVREQLRSQLKTRRIAYFLPVRGPLEKADGTMQEELQILYHFFGKEIFNCMLVIATNPPKKQFQELGFDDEDVAETKRVFYCALTNAIDDKDIACPPIVYIGLNDKPEEALCKIRNASVLKEDTIFPLTFGVDTCALCSVKILRNENNEKVSVIDADGNVIPYSKSMCHPAFTSKYTTMTKVIGGVAHIFCMGMFLFLRKFDIDSWPGFTNSDEVCISCGLSPGAKGCQFAGTKVTITHDKKNVTLTPEHSNEL